jgi:hypothetical protein
MVSAPTLVVCDLPPPHSSLQNLQKRGPDSHPFIGYLPLDPTATKAQQAGMCVFFAGTVSLAAATVASFISTVSWAVVPAVMACEFGAFMGLMWRRGQLHVCLAQPDGSAALVSIVVHLMIYMCMCVAPWTNIRIPDLIGGQLYFWLIVCVARSIATASLTNH